MVRPQSFGWILQHCPYEIMSLYAQASIDITTTLAMAQCHWWEPPAKPPTGCQPFAENPIPPDGSRMCSPFPGSCLAQGRFWQLFNLTSSCSTPGFEMLGTRQPHLWYCQRSWQIPLNLNTMFCRNCKVQVSKTVPKWFYHSLSLSLHAVLGLLVQHSLSFCNTAVSIKSEYTDLALSCLQKDPTVLFCLLFVWLIHKWQSVNAFVLHEEKQIKEKPYTNLSSHVKKKCTNINCDRISCLKPPPIVAVLLP